MPRGELRRTRSGLETAAVEGTAVGLTSLPLVCFPWTLLRAPGIPEALNLDGMNLLCETSGPKGYLDELWRALRWAPQLPKD